MNSKFLRQHSPTPDLKTAQENNIYLIMRDKTEMCVVSLFVRHFAQCFEHIVYKYNIVCQTKMWNNWNHKTNSSQINGNEDK